MDYLGFLSSSSPTLNLMAFDLMLVGSLIDPVHFTTLADCQSEQVSGGRRGRDDDAGSHRRSRSGRDCQPGQLGSMTGGYGSQSSGGLMGLNIFQINLAINMIFGGSGNSILNMQGNQLSAL